MKIPPGMEPMVFSYAYYKINDFGKVIDFLRGMEDKGLFNIDSMSAEKKELSGAFLQDYPKGHWNATPGAKQVLGGAKIEKGILTIDATTKGRLKNLRMLLEQLLGSSIEFQKEKFEDVMEMLRKK